MKPDQEGEIINVIFIIVVLVNVIVCDVINETMMSGEVLEAGNNSIWWANNVKTVNLEMWSEPNNVLQKAKKTLFYLESF